MEARLSILFYGKKTRNESDKILSIYLRVTINGNRFEVSTQRCVETDKWSSTAGKVKGNTEEVRKTNQYLDNVKQKVYDYQKKILQDGKPFTKETLRLEWYGLNEHIHSLVEGLYPSPGLERRRFWGGGRVAWVRQPSLLCALLIPSRHRDRRIERGSRSNPWRAHDGR